jgi:hypothetical protein
MEYSQLVSEIKRYFPNHYRRHYKQYMADGSLWERVNIAEGLAHEINEYFVEMQTDGYKADELPRPLQLPPRAIGSTIELLTDYVLANYHLQGLTLRREANGQSQVNEDFPPLGEGAREYLERCFIGLPINPDERRRTKTCEVCESPFIDNSRAKNAKVCGQICRTRKDALRQRERYNKSELGLRSEKRLKRYRERQELEYPFYSPQEMYELSNRSEQVAEEKKIDAAAYRQDEEFDQVRFNGKRKPKYVGRDEFSEKPFNYRPLGRPDKKKIAQEPGPVIVRKMSDFTAEQLEAEKFAEADKMKGLWPLEPRRIKDSQDYTLEKHAI